MKKKRLRPHYGVNGGGTTIGVFDECDPRPPDVRRMRVFYCMRAIAVNCIQTLRNYMDTDEDDNDFKEGA